MSQSQKEREATSQGSQTTTQTSEPQQAEDAPRILRLRGGNNGNGRSVQWAEGVVDNEGLGRKSSKVCCIYHKPKAVGESSDESSSDSSDSDSDADSDNGANNGKKKVPNGDDRHSCGHKHSHGKKSKKQKRPPSPNAYERVPKQKPKQQEPEKSKP